MADKASIPASSKAPAKQALDVDSSHAKTSAGLPKRSDKSSPMSVLEDKSLDVRPLRPFESRTGGRQINWSPTGNTFAINPPLASDHSKKPPALVSSRDHSVPAIGFLSELEQSGSRAVSSRVVSTASTGTTSSLEPLGETFEVPTILLSPGANVRRSIAEIPSLVVTKEEGRSHSRTQSNVAVKSPRILDASTSTSTSKQKGPGRSRSKSDTTMMEPMHRHDMASNSLPFASLMSTNFLPSHAPSLSPIASPRLTQRQPPKPTSPLIADFKVAKSR